MTPEEKIARVIDPVAFTNALIDPVVLRKAEKNALEKAQAILSLLPNTGEREKALEEAARRVETLADVQGTSRSTMVAGSYDENSERLSIANRKDALETAARAIRALIPQPSPGASIKEKAKRIAERMDARALEKAMAEAAARVSSSDAKSCEKVEADKLRELLKTAKKELSEGVEVLGRAGLDAIPTAFHCLGSTLCQIEALSPSSTVQDAAAIRSMGEK